MIKTYYQNYGILTSEKPDLNMLKYALNTYKIKSILSLDRDCGNEVKALIEKYKLPVVQTIYHIEPSSPAEAGRYIFNNINQLTSNKPILIHCKQGQDRTGFAVAAYLIKNGIMNAASAIFDVEQKLGYGKGISEVSKNTLDQILGYVKPKKTVDVSESDDKNIVNFDGGIIPFSSQDINTHPYSQDQTNSLSLLDHSGNENALGIRNASIRRGKLLKLAGESIGSLVNQISELLLDYSEEDLEEMLSLMRKVDDIQNLDVPLIGERSNYDGTPYSNFTGPSSTPGGSSSIALVEKAEPGGVVQI